jgi:hypothetical protein
VIFAFLEMFSSRPVQNRMLKALQVVLRSTSAGSNRVRTIAVPQLFVATDLLLKGIAGARNHHYLQLWRRVA